MTPESKSELIALALGWVKGPPIPHFSIPEWTSPGGRKVPAGPLDYMTDDAAAIRDVLPRLAERDETISVVLMFEHTMGWTCDVGDGEILTGWVPGDKIDPCPSMATCLCEAFAASQGGWDELERRFAK